MKFIIIMVKGDPAGNVTVTLTDDGDKFEPSTLEKLIAATLDLRLERYLEQTITPWKFEHKETLQ